MGNTALGEFNRLCHLMGQLLPARHMGLQAAASRTIYITPSSQVRKRILHLILHMCFFPLGAYLPSRSHQVARVKRLTAPADCGDLRRSACACACHITVSTPVVLACYLLSRNLCAETHSDNAIGE